MNPLRLCSALKHLTSSSGKAAPFGTLMWLGAVPLNVWVWFFLILEQFSIYRKAARNTQTYPSPGVPETAPLTPPPYTVNMKIRLYPQTPRGASARGRRRFPISAVPSAWRRRRRRRRISRLRVHSRDPRPHGPGISRRGASPAGRRPDPGAAGSPGGSAGAAAGASPGAPRGRSHRGRAGGDAGWEARARAAARSPLRAPGRRGAPMGARPRVVAPRRRR